MRRARAPWHDDPSPFPEGASTETRTIVEVVETGSPSQLPKTTDPIEVLELLAKWGPLSFQLPDDCRDVFGKFEFDGLTELVSFTIGSSPRPITLDFYTITEAGRTFLKRRNMESEEHV